MSSSKGVIEVPRGFGPSKIFSTSRFIHDHLLEVVEDYPFNMWREFKKLKKTVGSYDTFRSCISRLQRLKLIKFVRTEPSVPGFQPRRVYTHIPQEIDNEAWRNPRKSLYPISWRKRTSKNLKVTKSL